MAGIVFIVSVIVLSAAGIRDYSKISYCAGEYYCGGKLEHFACNKKVEKDFSCNRTDCTYAPYMDKWSRSNILSAVNDFRNEIAGLRAANMRQISWDFELEYFAKIFGVTAFRSSLTRWWIKGLCARTSEQWETGALFFFKSCPADHRPGLSITVPYNEHGLTLSALKQWKGLFEPTNSDISAFSDQINPKAASWTILAWGKATKMGCTFADVKCKNASQQVDVLCGLHCFVGPDVNTIGQPVFEKGPSCSACPEGTKCRRVSNWPKLCATRKDTLIPRPVVPDIASSMHHGAILLPPLLFVVV